MDAFEKLKKLQQDAKQLRYSHEKRPRQYADEICQLRAKEDRRAALERVPEDLREPTRKHVEIFFAKMRMLKNKTP